MLAAFSRISFFAMMLSRREVLFRRQPVLLSVAELSANAAGDMRDAAFNRQLARPLLTDR
jgi:hypothetical protein